MTTSTDAQSLLRFGVVGLGRAGAAMLPALWTHPCAAVVAVADLRREARERFTQDFDARAYESAAALCADPNVDAVYVATPHQYHAEHCILAASHGKHIVVEKPLALTLQRHLSALPKIAHVELRLSGRKRQREMGFYAPVNLCDRRACSTSVAVGLTLEDCDAIIQAVERYGVKLIVGHTASYNPAIRRMRQIIASGELGKLGLINISAYTPFLYRPRRPEELDTSRGGGIVFNQVPHQVDSARLLGGGLVQSVRAVTGGLGRGAADGRSVCRPLAVRQWRRSHPGL